MTPRKLRLYLDTSIWNFYFADDVPERMRLTRVLFDQIRRGQYDAYISGVVLDEIAAAPEPRRAQLNALVKEISPEMLQLNDEATALSREYIEKGTIPEKYADDARHIAVAVANNLDMLLSWNFAHIVKVKTRRVVSATSLLLGYKEIEICSPEEMIDDDS